MPTSQLAGAFGSNAAMFTECRAGLSYALLLATEVLLIRYHSCKILLLQGDRTWASWWAESLRRDTLRWEAAKREYKRNRPWQIAFGNPAIMTWNNAICDAYDKPVIRDKIEAIIAKEKGLPSKID